ncbi:hypothetical protein P170DRAFT_439077 [Aspergillus steynii IBT 23096]|uniref:Condensation domain-containing protein n=1 Tax=Aspergillus steynii IBT 23096 TaxID=1392250 RepID=A0A2I2G3F6_9EURO|nr:uncharacterized protein P170DRAFT_439077 [Aspergillus steynii IBT 23096]PLB47411.1 hypothetical protein P170DRAFT_439077 [Aspergillus steynii IBT 23096]
MGWLQVAENRWERPSNGMEGYFVLSGGLSASLCQGREHYIISSRLKVDLKLSDAEASLRQAWTQLRHEQPQIATRVEGMNKVYEVPDETALQAWLAETFIVSSAADADELYRGVGPIRSATLYYVPRSSELVLRAHHHTLDGVGMLLLCHSYLSALASPRTVSFGDEPARLPPPLEEALGDPELPRQAIAEKGRALATEFIDGLPGLGPVSQVGKVPAGAAQFAERVFPARTSAAVVQACKQKGLSVTAALHAAYVRAIAKYADPEGSSRYVTVSQFNFRPFLREPYGTSQYAAAMYYSILPVLLEKPTEFEELAQTLDSFYKSGYKETDDREASGSLTRTLQEIVQTPEFLTKPVSRDALVSSLGVAERHLQQSYGEVATVQDLRVGVDIILGMSMILFYTFRDQLRLVYSFNDAYEDRSQIERYLDEMQRILLEELVA